jgi:hypothetical protein
MPSAYITTFLPFLMHLPYIVGFQFRLLPSSKKRKLFEIHILLIKKKISFCILLALNNFFTLEETNKFFFFLA